MIENPYLGVGLVVGDLGLQVLVLDEGRGSARGELHVAHAPHNHDWVVARVVLLHLRIQIKVDAVDTMSSEETASQPPAPVTTCKT